MGAAAGPDAKVLVHISPDDGPTEVETLLSTSLGDDKFRIESVPLWSYGVSLGDTVLAPFSAREGLPTFMGVMRKSGNRTVRVALDPPLEPGNESADLLQGLVELGCTYHAASPRYVAVTVPPAASLDAVRNHLIVHDAIWEHADPTFAELFPDEA